MGVDIVPGMYFTQEAMLGLLGDKLRDKLGFEGREIVIDDIQRQPGGGFRVFVGLLK